MALLKQIIIQEIHPLFSLLNKYYSKIKFLNKTNNTTRNINNNIKIK